MLTENEKKRIKEIRKNLSKFKRKGEPVETWEAYFFLRILDRLGKKWT